MKIKGQTLRLLIQKPKNITPAKAGENTWSKGGKVTLWPAEHPDMRLWQ